MTQFATFAQWLRARRKARGLTQENLADRIGCSPETVRKIEAGRRRPSRQMVKVLAQHFDVSGEDEQALMRLARLGHEEDDSPAELALPQWPTGRAGRATQFPTPGPPRV